tara:strand:- start:57 stop:368 length:312 start_codon:yes stop_codon:yes gene_type:complete
MSSSPTLVELLEEFSDKYKMDALGMSIDRIKAKISAEDFIRLDELVNPVDPNLYRVTVYIEIEANNDEHAMNKVTEILSQPAVVFDNVYKFFHVDVKDITEGE